MIELKSKLMVDLQRKDLKVHVDFGEDINQTITQQFLEQNNVKIVIQIVDPDKILMRDRRSNDSTFKQIPFENLASTVKKLV